MVIFDFLTCNFFPSYKSSAWVCRSDISVQVGMKEDGSGYDYKKLEMGLIR